MLLAAAAALALLIGPAQASTTTKFYNVTISATPVAPATTRPYTIKLTNCSLTTCDGKESSQTLGSANVGVPKPLVVTDLALGGDPVSFVDGGRTWTIRNVAVADASSQLSSVLELRATASRHALPKGASVSRTVSVTSCAVGSHVWQTRAKQSNDFSGTGNDFVPWGAHPTALPGTAASTGNNSATVTTQISSSTGAPASFVIEESTALGPMATVGTQTAGSPFTLRITAKDACGNTSAYGGTATLTGNLGVAPNGTQATYAGQTGSASITFAAGVATPQVTAYKAEQPTAATATTAASPTVTVSVGAATATSNAFAVRPGALADFVFATVGTNVAPPLATPRYVVEKGMLTVTATAYDAYGNVKTDYAGGAVLGGNLASFENPLPAPPTPPTYGSFGTWTGGSASASVTTVALQSAAQLTATDGTVSGPSNVFDVVADLCLPTDVECTASDGKGTSVRTPAPPTGGTMDLSFSATQAACGSGTVGSTGSLAIVNPVGYVDPIDVTFTYDKAITGQSGVAAYTFCLSKDGNLFESVVDSCSQTTTLPCLVKKSRTGVGDLEFVVRIAPNDPWGGIS